MSQNNHNKWNGKWSSETKGTILACLLIVAGGIMLFRGVSSNKQNAAVATNEPSTQLSAVTNPSENSIVEAAVVTGPVLVQTKEDLPVLTQKTIKKVNLDPSRTIALIGQVGDNALDAASKITELASESSEPIYLVLSGPGGSVLTGGILISAMQASRAPVYTICDVLCASMDSMIHQYGKLRFMTDRSIIMFHPASAGVQGDVDRMHSMVSFLKRFINKMELEVATRQGISFASYKAKTGVELWIDSEDALKENIIDGLVNYHLTKSTYQFAPQPQESKQQIRTNNPFDVRWICTTGYCKELTWKTSK